ncbi:hypothetical protein E0H86_05955 [Acinetobacter sp. ANC 4635]|uniref:DUF6988 family protein n=1 Tax=Acinetobacter sp. ANC 4635 TaxID=2529846 RepID=UPI00103B0B67|nr:hypothetical protein [Acinetobacter sp. ANC 4635]TCB31963.1 hypothetical protein E0H86_05955 [Acinetobacter sp. ANC 4635]
MEINEELIDGLLYASHHFDGQLMMPITNASIMAQSLRFKAADSLGFISIEHSASLRFLIAKAKCNTSAFALFRLQYEALVKALWAFYIASEEHLELIVGELSKEQAEKNNKKLPSISKMLQQLETGETPAHHTILQLIKFKEISWDALNSYVHSGLHAVNRNMNGYPAELVLPVIRQSNNLMYMAAHLLAILTGSSLIVEQVKLAKQNFLDCLQID